MKFFIGVAQSIVSIPLWDDWKTSTIYHIACAPIVSIPLWDDWKDVREIQLAGVCFVSIPLWDDWKRLLALRREVQHQFQFHYGMIGSL